MDRHPDLDETLALSTSVESLTLESSTSSSPSAATADDADDPLSLAIRFAAPSDLCFELDSLHDLASRGQWRAVLDKVARARSLSLLPAPHHHLVYLAFSLLSLVKLRRFRDADEELRSLTLEHDLDSPRFRYESYPDLYPGRTGSMLPFAVRYLHAELPQHLGDRAETLDRLYALLDLARSKIKGVGGGGGEQPDQWRRREAFLAASICRHHFSHREFDVCLLLIRDLLENKPSDLVLLSSLGYVQMQIGDLDGCNATFARVEGLREHHGGSGVEFENLVGRNRALGFVAAKDFRSAVREYEECIERDPTDVVAVNNKALCLLYSRDLSDSIKALEGALERVPTAALNETVVVNLCSMYELAYVNHGEIKKSLSNWIAKVAPDDFDSSCTRT